jgi:AcrR family transcriptional regulator
MGECLEKFNGKQIQAIELLAKGDLTTVKISQELGIGRRTLYQWRKQREFMDAVIYRARQMIREQLPELYRSAVKEAKKGKHSYFKTLLEHVDRLEQFERDVSDRHIVFEWNITNAKEDTD